MAYINNLYQQSYLIILFNGTISLYRGVMCYRYWGWNNMLLRNKLTVVCISKSSNNNFYKYRGWSDMWYLETNKLWIIEANNKKKKTLFSSYACMVNSFVQPLTWESFIYMSEDAGPMNRSVMQLFSFFYNIQNYDNYVVIFSSTICSFQY